MSFETLWSTAVQVQIRYWSAVGRLAARASAARGRAVPAPGPSPAAAEAHPEPPSALVLESDGGSPAVGMFLVENKLGRPVVGSIAPSAFVDPEGREVRPRLAFAPEVVRLRPGEQALIRCVAAFDDTLRPGVRYLGTISLPGLSSGSVAVVLRRRDTSAARPGVSR